MAVTDPYKTLGLSYGADDETVKKAYRTLAKKYHPDLNPGDAGAAKRMSEINAAYDMIRNGWTPSAAAPERPYGAPEREAYPGAGGAAPADPLEELLRQFGFRVYRSDGAGGYGGDPFESETYGAGDLYITVRRLLTLGRAYDALTLLSRSPERDAEWYYLSAAAHYNLGDSLTALSHARQAVQMEPDDPEYAELLRRIEADRSDYDEQSERYGKRGRVKNPCLWCCIGNFFVNLFANLFCGRGWGFCC